MSDQQSAAEALGLSDTERFSAANTAAQVGQASKLELLQCVRRYGRIDGILESALNLSLEDYEEIKRAWQAAPVPDRPKTRRRR